MSNAAITVDLNAKIAGFETEIKRATATLDNFGNKGNQIAAGLKGAFAGMAAGLSVGALAAFAKSGIDAADAINDMSLRLKVSVKDLASFKLAAEQSGTSLEGVGNGIARLTRSIGEAEGGNKKLASALIELGITARDPKEAFYQLADAVQNIQDPATRATLLNQVLGKSYQELIPLLEGGGQALRESAAASESFADAMARLAPDADRFNDQLATLKINAAGASAELLTRLVPSLAETAHRVRELLDDNRGISALVRAIAGLGKLPFDAIFGDIKAASTAKDRIAELKSELGGLESALAKSQSGGSRSSVVMRAIFGTPEELQQQVTVTKNQIEALEKFGDQVYKGKEKKAEVAGVASGVAYVSGLGKGLKKAKEKLDEIDPFGKERAAALKSYQDKVDETDKMVRDHLLKTMQDVHYESVTAWEEAGQALTDSMQTPAEKLTKQLEYIKQLLDKGVITPETFSRAETAARKSFDDIGKEADSMSDRIGDSLTDALMRGFEGGKDWASNFVDTLKNMFSTLVLRPMIEPIAKAGASMVTGALGMGSSGSAAASGGVLSAGSSFMSAMAPGAISAEIGMYAGGIAETLGASSAFASSIGAGIATAIPWIGGALAIGAALGLFGGKPSNKAAGGTYDFGTDSSTTWNMSGDKQASQETMDARSATLNSISGFDALITKLGGSIAAQSIGVDIGERDGVQFAIDGGPLQSYGSDANAALAQLFRELVAGSDGLSESFQTLLGQFEGTAEEMLYLGDALVTLQDYMDSDLISVALDQIEVAGRTAWQTWQSGNTSLREMAASYDGSLIKSQELAAATQTQYQLELSLIGQIQGLLVSTSQMFGSSIEQIQLSVMGPEQQYDYWRSKIDADMAALMVAVDPDEIAMLSGSINTGANAAYSLLDEGQQASLAPEFIAYLEAANDITTDRLNSAQDDIVLAHQTSADLIESAMMRVADAMMAAATTPTTINVNVDVDTPADVEVGYAPG